MPITQVELGRRIRTAREACRMTQEEVARTLSLSRSAIVQIEAGNRSVSSLELAALAHLFGRDLREFVAQEAPKQKDPLSVLLRAEPDVVSDPQTGEKLRTCLTIGRELSNLESLLGIDRRPGPVPYRFPSAPTRSWDAIRHGEAMADDERRRLALGDAPASDLAELLDSHGIRAGLIELPDDISGLTLHDASAGFVIAVNLSHAPLRRRFSLAHEYAHVLADGDEFAVVSRGERRSDLLEVRANAFAAAFLLPAAGVRRFVAGLGKGRGSRLQAEVYDEAGSIVAESRSDPGSQDLQLYDVVLLAHHFGVSRIAALYRLRNLRFLTETEFVHLREREESGAGQTLEKRLALHSWTAEGGEAKAWFRHRPLGLALECYRRELITQAKLRELALLVGVPPRDVSKLVREAGIDDDGPAVALKGEGE